MNFRPVILGALSLFILGIAFCAFVHNMLN